MVTAIGRRRYRMSADDAEDVFQDSVLTYLLSRNRYPAGSNHFGVLVGVFHRKALASLRRSRRRVRSFERVARRLASARRAPEPPDAAMIRAERSAAIQAAVNALADDVRETLLCLAEGRHRRFELIERLGINRNTFDSRLHVARKRLRQHLARRGGV